MPTGETPQPAYKRGDSLAYGQATAANSAQGMPQPTPGIEDKIAYQPQGQAEQYLYGPTDRPNEPITAGVPFGPGPDTLPSPTDDQVVRQVAEQALNDPRAPKELKRFAQRVMEGQ